MGDATTKTILQPGDWDTFLKSRCGLESLQAVSGLKSSSSSSWVNILNIRLVFKLSCLPAAVLYTEHREFTEKQVPLLWVLWILR